MKKKLLALVATTALMVTMLIGILPMSASAASTLTWDTSLNSGAAYLRDDGKVELHTVSSVIGQDTAMLLGGDNTASTSGGTVLADDDLAFVDNADLATYNSARLFTFTVNIPAKATEGSSLTFNVRNNGHAWAQGGFQFQFADLDTDSPKIYVHAYGHNAQKDYFLNNYVLAGFNDKSQFATDGNGMYYMPYTYGSDMTFRIGITGAVNTGNENMALYMGGNRIVSQNMYTYVNLCKGVGTNATYQHAIRVYGDAVTTAIIDKGTAPVKPAEPTTEEIVEEMEVATLEGGSVRLDTETKGLRFTSYVAEADLATLADLEDVASYEFGTLMMPTAGLTGDLTLDTADALKVVQTQWLDPIGCPEGTKRMTAVLWNIPAEAYGMEITARAYLKVTLDDTTEVVVYSTATAASIADVAAAAYADQEGQGYEAWELNILKEYAGITE